MRPLSQQSSTTRVPDDDAVVAGPRPRCRRPGFPGRGVADAAGGDHEVDGAAVGGPRQDPGRRVLSRTWAAAFLVGLRKVEGQVVELDRARFDLEDREWLASGRARP